MKKNITILIGLMCTTGLLIWISNRQPADAKPTPPPATAELIQATEINDSSPSVIDSMFWIEERDESLGFGIAVPCWWEATSTSVNESTTMMTIRNYDEAFFLANSSESVWLGGTPPNEVISMDIIASTNIDPSLDLSKAYLQSIDTNNYTINNAIERTLGGNSFTIFILSNNINPSEPNQIVYVTKLGTNSILIFSTTPTQAIHSLDAQAILSSLADNQEETVKFPKILPSPPLINKPCDL